MSFHAVAISGSLRAASSNTGLIRLAQRIAPDVLTIDFDDPQSVIQQLPFYNEDIDTADAPAAVSALRAAAAGADAALVVTPEYNGSIPGVLKNAIDWLSRPWGDSALKDKPLAVIGTALGRYGGAWAHDETRKSFGIAGARVVESISLSLPAGPLDGKHPREDAAVVAAVREALATLVAEVG
jgi:NAD(P)H-dependent FMN reductase